MKELVFKITEDKDGKIGTNLALGGFTKLEAIGLLHITGVLAVSDMYENDQKRKK